MSKSALATVARYASYGLSLLSLVFVYRIAKDVALEVPHYTAFTYAIAAASCFGYAVFPFVSAYTWKISVELVSRRRMPFAEALSIYLKSSIAKYLPGNVLHYVGRNYVGVQYGWSHAHLALGSFLEVICLVAIPFGILAVLYAGNFWTLPESYSLAFQMRPNVVTALVVGALVVAALVSRWIFAKGDFSNIRKFLLEADSSTIARGIAKLAVRVAFISIATMLAYTLLFYIVASNLFGVYFRHTDFINVACSLSVAGYAGILTPGVPGGIGVKESITVILLSAYGYDRSSVAILAILTRGFLVIGDVVAFLIAMRFGKPESDETLSSLS